LPRLNQKHFYISAIKKYGTSSKGVNWNSEQSQEIRFDIILDLLPEDLQNYIICDAGCGFGDFYKYIKQNRPKKYIGIDSLEIMCEIAKKNTKCEIVNADICKDQLPLADFYICSGAMNTLTLFETYQFIRNCFLACGNGFVFNILHGDKQSKNYNYISTCQIEKFAKELGVKKVILKDGYLTNDITVGFFK
jgi:SAM-dependent methyltransferase